MLFPLDLDCSGTLFKIVLFCFYLLLIYVSLVNIKTSLPQPLPQIFYPAGTPPYELIFISVEVELDPLIPR